MYYPVEFVPATLIYKGQGGEFPAPDLSPAVEDFITEFSHQSASELRGVVNHLSSDEIGVNDQSAESPENTSSHALSRAYLSRQAYYHSRNKAESSPADKWSVRAF
jgi:hypothetical protein